MTPSLRMVGGRKGNVAERVSELSGCLSSYKGTNPSGVSLLIKVLIPS